VDSPDFHEGITLTFHTGGFALNIANVLLATNGKNPLAVVVSEGDYAAMYQASQILEEVKKAGIFLGLVADSRLMLGDWYLVTLDEFVESSSTMFKDILDQCNQTHYAGNKDE
jgi:hypothetical protein